MDIDNYVYPNTHILKNRFDIKDKRVLDEAEAEFTSLRLKQIMEKQTLIKGDYDFEHLCKIHHFIFQDIYEWAGESRKINIEKKESSLGGLSVEYEDKATIQKTTNSILHELRGIKWEELTLEKKAEAFAKNLARLWKVHGFREGNTRTTVTFCCKFAESRGIEINPALFEKNSEYMRNALVAANAYFSDLGDLSKPEYLYRIVKDSLQNTENRNLSKASLQEKKELIRQKKEKLPKQSLRTYEQKKNFQNGR